MKTFSVILCASVLLVLSSGLALAALTVPTEIQLPGTQPGEAGNLESPDKCDNCHGGYNRAVEPAFNWRGSMMANAGRDPIFWATLAIAEQDFEGAGDLCIRCHSTSGWHGGRSTPTDGSGLAAGDADGVDCDTCHKMTNPDDSEHLGVMNYPFIANDGTNGYHGTGMLSLSSGNAKLGPYSDAAAKHQFMQSRFHRDVDFCGSCHDVSNPAVGDLAHNNGVPTPLAPGNFSGIPGSPVAGKAAFNNFPFQYGIVERTFSEFKAGALSRTLVADYGSLPAGLKAGAIKAAYDSAGGNYKDGSPRYFSCQTCHMRAVTGVGANKAGTPVRADLPLHDMTGGNYWMPDVIAYQNANSTLRLGGGLTTTQLDALKAGKERAIQQLQLAAALSVDGDTLKVANLTGHKLITGYPEGRRMWLNIKWYDDSNNLLDEDGEYGELTVAGIPGAPTVQTLLDPDDPNTRVYEAHYAMTQEWANQLLDLGHPPELPLSFDRVTGAVDYTLGELAAQAEGTSHETFHFVLNNAVVKDNRIPPYGMSYSEALKRNALPVPADQFGSPGTGGTYNHWDEVTLSPPSDAAYATIDLLYQPTSWEYVQFLYLANKKDNAFLASEGDNLLEAWLNTGMAAPVVMASAAWGGAPAISTPPPPELLPAQPQSSAVALSWVNGAGTDDSMVAGFSIYFDQSGKASRIADLDKVTSYTVTGLSNGVNYCFKVTTRYAGAESAFSNIECATPTNNKPVTTLNARNLLAGQNVKTGNGKNATTSFVTQDSFTAGSTVTLRVLVIDDESLTPVSGATVAFGITDGQNATVTTVSSAPSGSDGYAEATWKTTTPHKNGAGGTLPDNYAATVNNVTLTGALWDGVKTSIPFSIQ